MPKGPQGRKRPADVIGNAVHVMRIATGEETEELDHAPASAAAQLGKLGGAEPDGRAAGRDCSDGGGQAVEESLIGCVIVCLSSRATQFNIERQIHR